MQYLTVCVEQWENGKLVLPRIERVITAESELTAREMTMRDYPQYNTIQVFEWQY